ncbi:hypothetical protein [Streptomyces sp. SJL17-1]|uniref:hypothetical protein n=1 Tax=Streptomyces sp. SJL17-1 TaxID=2967223 RepID=UPI002966983E|nr:hypothetical protein [Streptomyces sp. SJL17-1]
MTTFLATLGGKLADTWVSLLVLPGLLYLAVASAASVLGHRHALDHGVLTARIDALADDPALHEPGTVVVFGVLLLVVAAGVSRLAAALGAGVERLWLGDWPPPLRPAARALTRRRTTRWEAADAAHRRALTARALQAAADGRDAPSQDPATPGGAATDGLGTTRSDPGALDTVGLNEARNRISLTRPARPTWMGDRLIAADARVHRAYRIDLTSAWPRLWLLLPETAHAEVQAARSALTASARRAAWGLLYVLPALWWWPAALIAAVTWTGAWRQGRVAVHEFAELVESAVDLHGRDLAAALGIPCEEQLTATTGLAITRTLRKGT